MEDKIQLALADAMFAGETVKAKYRGKLTEDHSK